MVPSEGQGHLSLQMFYVNSSVVESESDVRFASNIGGCGLCANLRARTLFSREPMFTYYSQENKRFSNKMSIGHIVHLRNRFRSIDTIVESYDNIITLIWNGENQSCSILRLNGPYL